MWLNNNFLYDGSVLDHDSGPGSIFISVGVSYFPFLSDGNLELLSPMHSKHYILYNMIFLSDCFYIPPNVEYSPHIPTYFLYIQFFASLEMWNTV